MKVDNSGNKKSCDGGLRELSDPGAIRTRDLPGRKAGMLYPAMSFSIIRRLFHALISRSRL
jgi:hypothetical protein